MGCNIIEASHMTREKNRSEERIERYYSSGDRIIKFISSANHNIEYMTCDIIETNKSEFDQAEILIDHLNKSIYGKRDKYCMDIYLYDGAASIYITGNTENEKDRTNIFMYILDKNTQDVLSKLMESKDTGIVIDYNGKTLEFPKLDELSIKNKAG